MGAQLRVYTQKIKSAQTTKKITKAMELIAASRIQKALARVEASSPYARAITRAVSAVATYSNEVHDLTLEVPCAGTDGTPPVRGMVALPLAGTAILEVTGDLPSAGSATLAIYTEPTDGASVPVFLGEDVPPPAVPPGGQPTRQPMSRPSPWTMA